jgi:tetratricopeptide (TPR) repeat protein
MVNKKHVLLNIFLFISLLLFPSIEILGNSQSEEILRGRENLQLGNFDEAIRCFKKAIEIDPNAFDAYYYLGSTYARRGDLQEAFICFTEAISINPKYIEAYRSRGEVQIALGNYKGAIENFDEIIKLDPRNPRGYLARCTANFLDRHYNQAIKDCSKSIELNPDLIVLHLAYFQRGEAYAQLNDYDQAMKDYNKVLEILPDFADAFVARGELFSKLDNYDRSLKDFSKAIELAPKDASAYNAIAWFYATCRDSKYRDGKKAVQYAEKAVLLSENIKRNVNTKAAIYDTLAASYAEIGDFNRAVLMESKALNLYRPVNAEDKTNDWQRKLIEAYKSKETYIQWQGKMKQKDR